MARKPINTARLRDIRRRRGLSQRALADAVSDITGANIPKHNIKAWEDGSCRPPQFALLAICRVLRVPTTELEA